MNEIYNLLNAQNITPNEFYILHCIDINIKCKLPNVNLLLEVLKNEKFIDENNKLTLKSRNLVEEINKFFKVTKKKTDTQLMGVGYEEFVVKYSLLFPKMKLPSGKQARSDVKNLETGLKWFFNTYNYSWETILKATAKYVDEYEMNQYMYMRTSQYFIRKQNSDRTWDSELANYCNSIIDGEDELQNTNFSDRVV